MSEKPEKPVKPEMKMSPQQYNYLKDNNSERLTELQDKYTIKVDNDMGLLEEEQLEKHNALSEYRHAD